MIALDSSSAQATIPARAAAPPSPGPGRPDRSRCLVTRTSAWRPCSIRAHLRSCRSRRSAAGSWWASAWCTARAPWR